MWYNSQAVRPKGGGDRSLKIEQQEIKVQSIKIVRKTDLDNSEKRILLKQKVKEARKKLE